MMNIPNDIADPGEKILGLKSVDELCYQGKVVLVVGKRKSFRFVIDIVICLNPPEGINIKTRNPFRMEHTMIAIAGFSSDFDLCQQIIVFINANQLIKLLLVYFSVDHLNTIVTRARKIEVDKKFNSGQWKDGMRREIIGTD